MFSPSFIGTIIILEFLIEPQIYYFTIYLPNFTNKKNIIAEIQGEPLLIRTKFIRINIRNFKEIREGFFSKES
jgi:hypothetical protein